MAGKGQAEGCAACAKWLLIIFNVLFCILGIGLLAAGIYAYIQLSDYLNFLGDKNVNVPAIMLIVFGCITFLIATLGCVGACKESPCMLFTFAGIISVLLIAEIGVGIAAFVMRGDVEKLVDEHGPDSLKEYNNPEAEGVRKSWDLLQNEFKCCGFNGPLDYGILDIPASCRVNKETPLPIHSDGCKDSIKKLLKDNIIIAAGVGIGFGVIELMGIVFACCVACSARKGEYA